MAGEEIRELAARIPSSTVLAARGSPARLDRLARSDSLAGYQLLHFATHANVTDTWVGETALVLDGAGDSAAGRITTADITRRWRLDADLVTLSACETMVGPASKTEGFLGLEQALLAVGARRLLVSAWRVDDRATGMLMSRFYRNLLDPRAGPASEADALAEARHWLRSWTAADGSRPYAHPVYWAGFVLIEGGIAGRRPPHAGDDPR
jgi:CHAT domain-containing protein